MTELELRSAFQSFFRQFERIQRRAENLLVTCKDSRALIGREIARVIPVGKVLRQKMSAQWEGIEVRGRHCSIVGDRSSRSDLQFG